MIHLSGRSVQGGGRENQDAFYHGHHPHDPSVRLLLVLDGHGQFGRTAAQGACRYLRHRLELPATLAELRRAPAAALEEAFGGAHQSMQNDLRRAAVEKLGGQATVDRHGCPVWREAPEFPWKAIQGGSTATVAVWLDHRWVVAQAGDSDLLWLRGEEHRLPSPDHSPASREEMARLVRDHAGEDGMPTVRLVYDILRGSDSVPLWASTAYLAPPPPGHYYKNVRNEIATMATCQTPHPSKLAFLRTLGDYSLQCHGISWRPEVQELPDADLLLLATDGIWDLYTYDELIGLLRTYRPDGAERCVDQLMAHADRRSLETFGSSADDRTLLLFIA